MYVAGRENELLDSGLAAVSNSCNGCGLCVKQCEFLKRFGTPKRIADTFNPTDENPFDVAFACSLCGLCTAICPQGADPNALFLAMRRAAAAPGKRKFRAYRRLLAYEARGISSRYTWYGLPEGCDTVFFPGCALPGTRPRRTLALFRHLQKQIPSLGFALDCCSKPSHDLGRAAFFETTFEALKAHFLSAGVRSVVTACPSCHKVFQQYGEPLWVVSAYEVMAEAPPPMPRRFPEEVSIHDPCVMRFEPRIHAAVRSLIKKAGATPLEMLHSRRLALCCGEGGGVGNLHPDLSKVWVKAREGEVQGRRLITYCAGCSGRLSTAASTSHILDIIFHKEVGRMLGVEPAGAPVTYLNRLCLKHHLKRNLPVNISGTRPFPAIRWDNSN